MIRHVLFEMMGIEHSDKLPDCLSGNNKGEARYWETIDDERLLRPDFLSSWTKNTSWHKALWKEIVKRGPRLVPACTASIIDGMGESAMLKLVGRTTWKHMKERYTLERKSKGELELIKGQKLAVARKSKVNGRCILLRLLRLKSSSMLLFTESKRPPCCAIGVSVTPAETFRLDFP
jgi:hypothetical protein